MAGKRILVVEDEGIAALDIKRTLESFGYEVVGRVVTGNDAISYAESSRPDLVLMDIVLKGSMDGIDAAMEIKKRLSIPVIFLTAYAEDTLVSRAKLAEPFGYIIKPFNKRELHCIIEIGLFKHEAEQRLQQAFDESERLNKLLLQREFRIKELNETVAKLEADMKGKVDGG